MSKIEDLNQTTPLLYVHKPHHQIDKDSCSGSSSCNDKNKSVEPFNLSSENVEAIIKKFETLKQNQNDHPKIKQSIKKYGVILPFENCRYSIFQILSNRVELNKGHLSSIVYLLSVFEQFIELLDQFSEMASVSVLSRVSFQTIEKKVEEIDMTHEKLQILSSTIVDHIKNGTNLHEDGIVQLKEMKGSFKLKKNLVLGLASTSTIFGIAAISVGIVLAPFTGGVTLLSTIAGASVIVAGSATTAIGATVGIIGNKHFNQKALDIKRSIEALETLASQVEVLVISISKNETIKNQLELDFESLIQNELEFQNLFCSICFDIVKSPVIIPLPSTPDQCHYEIYCRECITNWHDQSLPNPKLPKSRLPFTLQSFIEPDFRTKGDAIRFNNLIKDMKSKLTKIITPSDNNN